MSLRIPAIVAGPIAAILIYALLSGSGLEHDARAVAGIGVWMALWWMTEAIPLAATSLIPLALFPLTGVMPIQSLADSFNSILHPQYAEGAKRMSVQINAENGLENGLDDFNRHLPLASMVCDVATLMQERGLGRWYSKILKENGLIPGERTAQAVGEVVKKWTKEDILYEFHKLLPDLTHDELNKNLDQRM